MAHALMRKGHDKRTAIRIARGVIQRAAATGRWGRGHAKPNVVAGAAASIAQRKAFSVAHKLSNDATGDIELDWAKWDAAHKGKSRKAVKRAMSRTKTDAPKVMKKKHARQAHLVERAQREQARRIAARMGLHAGKIQPLPGVNRVPSGEGKFRPNLRNAVSGFANDPVLDLRLGVFTEALHPRGPNGKWIPKGSAKYKSAVNAVRAAQRQGNTRLAKQILAGKAGPSARAVKVRASRLHKRNTLAKNDKAFAEHYKTHVARVDKTLESPRALAQATENTHATRDANGKIVWNRDRLQVQHKIVQRELAKQIASGAKPGKKALFLGGLPGAGKTRSLDKIPGFNQKHYVTVNPDIFKEHLARNGLIPRVKGLSPMEASSLAHEESSHMALMLAAEAKKRNLNIVWDITMAKAKSVDDRLKPLRDAGYSANAVFVDIPHSLSAERVRQRHEGGYRRMLADKSGKHLGERYVPSSFVASSGSVSGASSANREAFEAVKGKFDAYRLYNNFNGNKNEFPMALTDSSGVFRP